MNSRDLSKKKKEWKKKAQTAERVQWKGRYQSAYFKTEREIYRQAIHKKHSDFANDKVTLKELKRVERRYDTLIKKSKRREQAIKSYQKRVRKGTDALSKFTSDQRKEFAKKSIQTRIENRARKLEWEGLSHGEKIRRGKELARQRKLKRKEAGKRAWETRRIRELNEALEFWRKLLGIEEHDQDRSYDAGERDRENDGANDDTDLDELIDVYLKYGNFGNAKTREKMMNNYEFQQKLALRLAQSSPDLYEGTHNRSSMINVFIQHALKSPNIRDIKNPYDPSSVKVVSPSGLSSYDYMKKSIATNIERDKLQRLHERFEKFRTVLNEHHDKIPVESKKINFEYKPGKKWF